MLLYTELFCFVGMGGFVVPRPMFGVWILLVF